MKVSAIPAQITTVEDRIAGNLNLTQLILLAAPLFLSAVIFFLLPPNGSFAIYKLIIVFILASASSALAIRIKDKLLLDLMRIRLIFELRSHVYVYRKQRFQETEKYLPNTKIYKLPRSSNSHAVASVSTKQHVKGQELLNSGKYKVAFHSKSGGLVVKVTIAQ